MEQPHTIDRRHVEDAMREARRQRSQYICNGLGRVVEALRARLRHVAGRNRPRPAAGIRFPLVSTARWTVSGLADAAARVCFVSYRIGA